MALLGPSYPQPRRGNGRGLLLILGILFGLYFLNLAFGWVAMPESIGTSFGKYINGITGVLLIILGIACVMRPRAY